MSKIKLCGLTREADIQVVNSLKVDYIGFVFWPRSKRNVSEDQARMLKKMLDPSIKAVGVFVDPDMDFVIHLLQEGIIDVAQLHGKEDDSYIRKLKEASNKPVFKAFTIKDEDDVAKANDSCADYVLLDSGKGSGITFNWDLLAEIQRPYFLAGGLNLDNVEEAFDRLHPYAFDVSSGIETDGRKDAEKMRKFVSLIRNRL